MTFEEMATAMKTLEAARRTVICEPGGALKVETLLVRYGLEGLWTVRESELCPPGKLIIINDPPELTLPDVKMV